MLIEIQEAQDKFILTNNKWTFVKLYWDKNKNQFLCLSGHANISDNQPTPYDVHDLPICYLADETLINIYFIIGVELYEIQHMPVQKMQVEQGRPDRVVMRYQVDKDCMKAMVEEPTHALIKKALENELSNEKTHQLKIAQSNCHLEKIYQYISEQQIGCQAITGILLDREYTLEAIKQQGTETDLVRELRIAYFANEMSASSLLEQKRSLLLFSEFCKQEINANHFHALSIVIKYTLLQLSTHSYTSPAQKFIAEQKIAICFSKWYAKNEMAARSFYHAHSHLFLHHSTYLAIKALAAHPAQASSEKNKADTNDFFGTLKYALADTVEPLALVPLFAVYIDDPIKYAACLLWLIKNNVADQVIFSSGFIHQFIKQHIHSSGGPGNEIETFYEIVSSFSNTKRFLEQVKTISADIKGMEKYSLDGKWHPGIELISVKKKFVPCFHADEKNMIDLYDLFGNDFIKHALLVSLRKSSTQSLPKNHDAKLYSTLKKILNSSGQIIKFTSLIMMIYHHPYRTELLQLLASLLDEKTIEELVKLKNGQIFYLSPYLPTLANQASVEDINAIVDAMRESLEPFDYLIGLAAIVKTYRSLNDKIILLCSHEIINTIFDHSIYDNEYLYDIETQVPTFLVTLCHKLQSFIHEYLTYIQTTDYDLFNQDVYFELEDIRHNIALKLDKILDLDWYDDRVLRDIQVHNRYQLRVALIEQHAPHITTETIFQHLFNIITPSHYIDQNDTGLSEKERTLIEIICHTNNLTIRQFAVQHLTKPPYNKINWYELAAEKLIETNNMKFLLQLIFENKTVFHGLTSADIQPILEMVVTIGMKQTLSKIIEKQSYATPSVAKWDDILIWLCHFSGKYGLTKTEACGLLRDICLSTSYDEAIKYHLVRLFFQKLPERIKLSCSHVAELIEIANNSNQLGLIKTICDIYADQLIDANNSMAFLPDVLKIIIKTINVLSLKGFSHYLTGNKSAVPLYVELIIHLLGQTKKLHDDHCSSLLIKFACLINDASLNEKIVDRLSRIDVYTYPDEQLLYFIKTAIANQNVDLLNVFCHIDESNPHKKRWLTSIFNCLMNEAVYYSAQRIVISRRVVECILSSAIFIYEPLHQSQIDQLFNTCWNAKFYDTIEYLLDVRTINCPSSMVIEKKLYEHYFNYDYISFKKLLSLCLLGKHIIVQDHRLASILCDAIRYEKTDILDAFLQLAAHLNNLLKNKRASLRCSQVSDALANESLVLYELLLKYSISNNNSLTAIMVFDHLRKFNQVVYESKLNGYFKKLIGEPKNGILIALVKAGLFPSQAILLNAVNHSIDGRLLDLSKCLINQYVKTEPNHLAQLNKWVVRAAIKLDHMQFIQFLHYIHDVHYLDCEVNSLLQSALKSLDQSSQQSIFLLVNKVMGYAGNSNKISADTFDLALEASITHGRYYSMSIICNHPEFSSQESAKRAFQLCVSHCQFNSLVYLFCVHSGIKPSLDVINDELKNATSTNKTAYLPQHAHVIREWLTNYLINSKKSDRELNLFPLDKNEILQKSYQLITEAIPKKFFNSLFNQDEETRKHLVLLKEKIKNKMLDINQLYVSLDEIKQLPDFNTTGSLARRIQYLQCLIIQTDPAKYLITNTSTPITNKTNIHRSSPLL